MNNSVSQLILALETAHNTDDVEQLINHIAQFGELAIPGLLEYEKKLYRQPGRYKTVMRIYQLIGYPENLSAIPSIVSQASRINSSGWGIALNILINIGEKAVPEIRESLHFYFRDLDNYSPEIEGLCVLLEKIGSPSIDSLLPELLYLLDKGTDKNHIDEFALWPLIKIGSPKADDAVQILSKIISSRREARVREIAINALREFDTSATSSLVPILKECLSDSSEIIRDCAKSVLETLMK